MDVGLWISDGLRAVASVVDRDIESRRIIKTANWLGILCSVTSSRETSTFRVGCTIDWCGIHRCTCNGLWDVISVQTLC